MLARLQLFVLCLALLSLLILTKLYRLRPVSITRVTCLLLPIMKLRREKPTSSITTLLWQLVLTAFGAPSMATLRPRVRLS